MVSRFRVLGAQGVGFSFFFFSGPFSGCTKHPECHTARSEKDPEKTQLSPSKPYVAQIISVLLVAGLGV